MNRYVTGLFTKEHGKDGMKASDDAGHLVAAYSKPLETVIGLDKSLLFVQKCIQKSCGLQKCSPSLHQLCQANQHVERHGSREMRTATRVANNIGKLIAAEIMLLCHKGILNAKHAGSIQEAFRKY